MPLFDPAEGEEGDDLMRATLRLPPKLVKRLDAIAERETSLRRRARAKAPVVSRNDVVTRLLERGCAAYEAEEGLPPYSASATSDSDDGLRLQAAERPIEYDATPGPKSKP